MKGVINILMRYIFYLHFNECRLLGEWPNTYVYTKAITEDVVRKYSVGLPICIVRPSIVTSTDEEPIPGWINNIYGAVGIVLGAGMGLLRTLHCIPENTAEIIPADYVIANIIVAAWDIGKRKWVLVFRRTSFVIHSFTLCISPISISYCNFNICVIDFYILMLEVDWSM